MAPRLHIITGFANAAVLGTVTCYLIDEPGVPYNQSYLCLEKEMYYDKLESKQNKKTYKLASRTRSKNRVFQILDHRIFCWDLEKRDSIASFYLANNSRKKSFCTF